LALWSSSATCDAVHLTWQALQAYERKFDFRWGKQRAEYVELVSVSSNDRLNGNPVVREVKVNNALRVKISTAGRKAPFKDFPTQINTLTDLDNIL